MGGLLSEKALQTSVGVKNAIDESQVSSYKQGQWYVQYCTLFEMYPMHVWLQYFIDERKKEKHHKKRREGFQRATRQR